MSTSLIESLQATLGPKFALERELPGGGMSRVFLATETALDRQIVLKVIAPELTQSLSGDRFRREIQVVAHLQHPHIVPLLSAGQVGELLYYTMPFVEGESLQARLAREGELPVHDVVRLLGEIAGALSHAHRHGIVHRDIKPGNILLSDGQAQVTDFGLAKALASSTEANAVSTAGLALGTPTYMAPEQAAGDAAVDHRADLYALGVVAYEMLTGGPPFRGRTARALLAANVAEIPVPVGTRRPSVPRALEALVMRLLEKHPADRPQTADEILGALGDVLKPVASAARTKVPSGISHGTRWLIAGSVTAVVLLLGTVLVRGHKAASPAGMDERVVAVVPFRVTAEDSSLRYLREGMLDLLSTKLSGTEGMRTVDPRTMLAAWHRAGGAEDRDLDRAGALALARRVGAGHLLEGEATATSTRTVLSASLASVSDGQELKASVEGPPDSLTWMVDKLAAQLLALGAGESRDRLSALTSTSLPALRAYLGGRSALRHGAYPQAVREFERAIELDSSFALAGLGRTQGAIWLGEGYDGQGTLLAWRHRERLASRDRDLLNFMLAPTYPEVVSGKESMGLAEGLVAAAPDNADALATYADYMYHYGRLMGIPDAIPRSLRTYQRALALDSAYLPAWEHLGEILFKTGDTVAARQAIRLRLKRDSMSPAAARDRWFGRRILGDTAVGDPELTNDSLVHSRGEVFRLTIAFGGPFGDNDSLVKLWRATVRSERDRRTFERFSRWYYLARGWPRRALQVTSAERSLDTIGDLVLEGLYCDADSAFTTRLAREIPRDFQRPEPSEDPSRIFAQYAAAQFELANGKPDAARKAVKAWLMRPLRLDTASATLVAQLAARLLDAQVAARDRRPDALDRLMELDSLLEAGQPSFFQLHGNVEAARLWHERGDPVRALAAIRRNVEGFESAPLPRYLRDEGRYAALAGERDGAIKAYRHYLRLRGDAEPALQPEVAALRAELAALERTTSDR